MTIILWLAGCATESPPPPPISDPHQLINGQADFHLRIWTDDNPLLIDSLLDLKLQASAPVYLSLYAIHASGRTTRLMADRQVLANRTLLYPEPNLPLDLRLSPPVGTETFILVGTQIPLDWPESPADSLDTSPLLPLNLGQQELLEGLQAALWERDRGQWTAAVLKVRLEPRVGAAETDPQNLAAKLQAVQVVDGMIEAQHLRGIGGESLL